MNVEKFGKYRLLERIAVGGTAEVFRAAALRPHGEEAVVLKRLLPQHARDPRFCELMREEALLGARLEHPNIVRLLDFGQMQGTFFLALELVEGADLATLLDQAQRVGEPLVPAHAAHLAARISEALQYLHTQTGDAGMPLQMVHRDVSPQNILVSFTGEVKLADFGIARSIVRMDKTVDGTIKGKLVYMSPEQARGERDIGPASDIFALGSVLYETLFGQPPLRGDNDVDTLERVRRVDFTLEDHWLAPADRPLIPIVRRCLQREPEHRYGCAGELQAELDAYLSVAPVLASELGERVQALVGGPTVGSVDQLAGNLLGGGGGGTAVMAVRPGSPARIEVESQGGVVAPELDGGIGQQPAGPGRRGSRLGARLQLALVLALVVPLTVLVTLLIAGRWRTGPVPARPAAPRTVPVVVPLTSDGPLPAPDGAPLPETPRAETRARLALRSQPSGARVTIDGVAVGRTPLRVTTPAVPFVVEATRPGYLPWRRRLEPLEADHLLSIVLSRAPAGHGWLTVNSIPWARVTVDGRSVGTTPIRRLKLVAGKHQVVLRDGQGKLLRAFATRIAHGATRVHSFDATRVHSFDATRR